MRFVGMYSGTSCKTLRLTINTGLFVALLANPLAQAQKVDDGNGAFRSGKYRDLFAEQGHSPAETKAKELTKPPQQ